MGQDGNRKEIGRERRNYGSTAKRTLNRERGQGKIYAFIFFHIPVIQHGQHLRGWGNVITGIMPGVVAITDPDPKGVPGPGIKYTKIQRSQGMLSEKKKPGPKFPERKPRANLA